MPLKNIDDELERIDGDPGEVDNNKQPLDRAPEGGSNDGTNDGATGGNEGAETVQRTPRAPAVELTEEKIAELSARVTDRMLSQRAQREQSQRESRMTPEQIEKLLNPVKITKEFLIAHGIAEPTDQQVKMYQSMSDMQTKHHMSLMQVQLEALQRRMLAQAEPMFDYYQRQEAERNKEDFFKDYPKLRKFSKFVQFAASTVQATDANGNEKSLKAVKADIANATKALLKESGVDLDTLVLEEEETAATLGAETGNRVPQMTRMQGSGRSGAPSAKGGSNNPDADIYSD